MKVKKLIFKLVSPFFGNRMYTTIGINHVENRERWVEEKLKKIPVGKRILDAGAGELQFKKFCKHLEYVSQDFAQYNGEGNTLGLQTKTWSYDGIDIISDISSIPQPDQSFDAIMCIEVLEHIPDPILAIKEFSRLLKKDGQLIITAPFCSLTHFAPYHFATGFNKYYYEKHLSDHNFEIIEMTPNGNYFEFLASEVRRVPYVVSTYTKKKFNLMDNLVQSLFLNILEKNASRQIGSEDLLCVGYHIVARKK